MILDDTSLKTLIKQSISLAESWQNRGNDLLSEPEKRFQHRMGKLLTHPLDKVIMTQLIDQSFRAKKRSRVADQLIDLFRRWGIPHFFSPVEKIMTQVFISIGKIFSWITIPLFINQLRKESNRVILPGDKEKLIAHLTSRANSGVLMNINHLGEAVLGEEEAKHRFDQYMADLADPHIHYISIKISTIYSQINSLAFAHTVSVITSRLTVLYRQAKHHSTVGPDGKPEFKFVNLDMEEYRDLEVTAEAFKQTLDQDEFGDLSAGIVLQAYLPDSFAMQRHLTAWAVDRVKQGKAPIKIRIVKGANMEMEKIEAAIFNWPLAPYDNKLDVDANFKQMVDFGMTPEHAAAVHLGIASHNLFELAFSFSLSKERHVEPYISFEMLEGMADHIRRAIQETTKKMLLYAPVASKDQFISAIAYLIRRLDENTAEENFLRYAPGMTTGSREWGFLKEQFVSSCTHMARVDTRPRRIQDRMQNQSSMHDGNSTFVTRTFENEPDTDWSLEANRRWAEHIREVWRSGTHGERTTIPLVVAGREITEDREARDCHDPSRYGEHVHVATFTLANEDDIDQAVQTAREDRDGWRRMSLSERHGVLAGVAENLRKRRGDLIGAAALTTGKVFRESDIEISEAIDFVEFYPWSLSFFQGNPHMELTGKGVGVVISPWNFPIAIPCGGMAAALAAGNTVILKPASAAILPAWILCNCFWDAGISRHTLQFLPLSGDQVGHRLTTHPDVDFIIFTGGTDTAMSILHQRPDVHFAGETGGKNSTIVTAMADRDMAIKNVIHSAFANGGQKCSATSLLILEKEVYDDPHFRRQLVDAAKSYQTGSAWQFRNLMGPLITPPKGHLNRALTTLESGEEWALPPENKENNPYIYGPSIKWHVSPGSYTHNTEFFGPLLAVMRADNLSHAVDITNQTGYGLTAGLESLDKREQDYWKERIRAGNLYINRGTTGAVVYRQPFGGMGKSAIGAGVKAGGINYALQFMDKREIAFPLTPPSRQSHALLQTITHLRRHLATNGLDGFKEELDALYHAIKSYLYHWENEFSLEQDYFHLRGQDNLMRYRSLGHMVIRVHEADTLFDILARVAAADITRNRITISLPPQLATPSVDFLLSGKCRPCLNAVEIETEADGELAGKIDTIQGIRYAGKDRVPPAIYAAASKEGFHVAGDPVLMDGRLELLHYMREQSLCVTYHRYGNLGNRADEFD